MRAVAELQSAARAALSKIGHPAFFCLVSPDPGLSHTVRLATYTTVLERTAPRLLSDDILRGKDQKIRAVLKVIAQTKPNILALQSFDWDAQLRAARAFKDALNARVLGHAVSVGTVPKYWGVNRRRYRRRRLARHDGSSARPPRAQKTLGPKPGQIRAI